MKKILLFIIPSLMFIKINLVGVLYFPELILIVYFIFSLPKNYFLVTEQLKPFIQLVFLFLFAQIFSDIYRESSSTDFLRGWANILLFLVNTIALFFLLDNDKNNFFIFGLGIAVGLFLSFIISPNIWAQGGNVWKFGYGYAITFTVALISTCNFCQNRLIQALIFLFLSLLNFYFGFRSLAGICLLVFFLISGEKFNLFRQLIDVNRSNLSKTFLIFCFFLLVSFLVNFIYTFLVTNLFLGYDELVKFETQMGPLGILIGGRQELITSFYAITDSPIIGYGSWPKNPFSEQFLSDILYQLGYYTPAVSYFGDRLPTHSHILGSWITAGFLGIFIWLWFLLKLITTIVANLTKRDNWNSFLYFICILMIWSIFFNHFNGSARFYDGYYLCLLLFSYKKLNSNA